MRAHTLLFSILTVFTFSVSAQQAGDLDPTFGNGGKVIDGRGNVFEAVAVQVDGKIVSAGSTGEGLVAVARYNPDGTPDLTFGSGGLVTTNMDHDAEGALSVAIQPDGKITVLGCGAYFSDDWSCTNFLVRYNPNGSLDTTFGFDGIVNLAGYGLANDLAIQPDGKIVIPGSDVVIRLNSNGSFDTTFDGDGWLRTPISASSVLVQPDGKIVAAGAVCVAVAGISIAVCDFGIVRYNSDGSLDATFDGDTTDFDSLSDSISSVAIQPDGKIIAVGRSTTLTLSNINVAVARYNPDGSLDTSFDGDGKVTTSISSGNAASSSVAIQANGKIVAAGTSDDPNGDFALVRYNPNGSLDTTFGGGDGITNVDFNNSGDVANGMALDSQGRAVVVGRSDEAFALARFLLGGTTPTPTPGVRTNFALASNGGVVSASSEYSGFPALAANNGDRKGLDWANGGIWNDNSRDVYPDFLQIDLAGTKTIDEIDIFAVQDNFQNPSEPTLSDTFTQYGVTAFDIQYWDGSAWVTVPGGSITGNNKVWNQVTFPAVTTDKIRIVINNGLQNYSRLVEVEAWGSDPSECAYSFSSDSASVSSNGATGGFNVTTDAECSWTAHSNVGWITINSGAGTGNGSVTFSVLANSGSARSETINVGSQIFTVNQAASRARRRRR